MDVANAPEGINVPRGLNAAVTGAVLDRPRPQVDVLEAGCGSASHLDFGPAARITGIDISPSQLERNKSLDVRVIGDLQSHPLPNEAFDVVVCWNVLEHLPRPREALDNMLQALRVKGVLVLAVPNACSIKGWVTRLTPHAFHVWVYRRVFGIASAGSDDHGPFPTYFADPISPEGLRNYAREHTVDILYWAGHEDYGQQLIRQRLHLGGRLWREGTTFVRWLTRGHIEPEHTDIFIVLVKRASHQAAAL
jgi:SAM-dependent methyltransferase